MSAPRSYSLNGISDTSNQEIARLLNAAYENRWSLDNQRAFGGYESSWWFTGGHIFDPFSYRWVTNWDLYREYQTNCLNNII